MNTSFKVTGKKSAAANSTISHIERNHSLNKNPTLAATEKSKNSNPHILVFRKNQRLENKSKPKITHTQISKKIQTYKSRLKKHELELLELTEPKKIELKQKTIQRQKDKIAELTNQKENTVKGRSGYAVDFVDIPFSITKCKPELLSKHEFKQLADIAEQVTLSLFEIDKDELGKVAHLDQASAHIHISFHVPENKSLKQMTKITYREAQLMFNRLVVKQFERLPIENICEKKNKPNQYLSLQDYKHECEKKNLKNQYKIEKEDLKQKSKTKLSKKSESIEAMQEQVATLKADFERGNEVYQSLQTENFETEQENQRLKNENKSLQSQKKILEVKVHDLDTKSVSRPSIEDYEAQKEEIKTTNSEFREIHEYFEMSKEKVTSSKGVFDWIKTKFTELKERICGLEDENKNLKTEVKNLKEILESKNLALEVARQHEIVMGYDDEQKSEVQTTQSSLELK